MALRTLIEDEELSHHILQFLEASDLCKLSCTDTLQRRNCSQDTIWRNLCRRCWSDKVVSYCLTEEREKILQSKCDLEGCSWKALYVDAIRDSRRTLMSAEELCGTSWLFSSGEQTPIFYMNGLLVMEMWPPYSLFWSLNDDGSLQVNNFPKHEFRRRADWGWIIENVYVSFKSVGVRKALASPIPDETS